MYEDNPVPDVENFFQIIDGTGEKSLNHQVEGQLKQFLVEKNLIERDKDEVGEKLAESDSSSSKEHYSEDDWMDEDIHDFYRYYMSDKPRPGLKSMSHMRFLNRADFVGISLARRASMLDTGKAKVIRMEHGSNQVNRILGRCD